MTTLFDRIRQRLEATSSSQRSASLRGGLSADALGKILKKPDQSPTLETIEKLAKGLQTTPEWLAYGIGSAQSEENVGTASDESGSKSSSALVPVLPGRTFSNDSSYIQVASGTLHQLVSGVLQNESIPQAQADAYADAVLELIRGRASAHVVLRLEAPSHSAAAFPEPASDDQS